MESEDEDQLSHAKKEILDGNLGSIFPTLKTNLEKKIMGGKVLSEKNVYFLFAKFLLGKCIHFIRSKLYTNANQLVQLSKIVVCCSRLVKLARGIADDVLYHRVLYHFFSFLMEQSMYLESAELAVVIHELFLSEEIRSARNEIVEEKRTVSKNIYLLCWNEAVSHQKKNAEVSQYLYTAALLHLSVQCNKQGLLQKLKQISMHLFASGVAIEQVEAFVCQVCVATLESHRCFESAPDLILQDFFSIICDWVQCRHMAAADRVKDCDLSVFESALKNVYGLDFPLHEMATTVLEIIDSTYKLQLPEKRNVGGFDRECEKVKCWLETLESPSCESLRPELYGYLNFCFRITATKVGHQFTHFARPTPIQLLPIFVKIFQYQNSEKSDKPLSNCVKARAGGTISWPYMRLLLIQLKTEIPLIVKNSADEHKLLEACSEVAETLKMCFLANINNQERALLVMELTALGTFLYKKGFCSLAVLFLDLFYMDALEFYLSVADWSDLDVSEQDILKCFEVLILCHIGCQDLAKAFSVAARCLAAFGLKHPELFRIWLTIKKATLSNGSCKKRTIKSELDSLNIYLPVGTMCELMKNEFVSYANSSSYSCLEDDCYIVATELLEMPVSDIDNPVEAASFYLEIIKLSLHSSKIPINDLLQKSIDILEGSNYEEKEAIFAKSLLASAYFWLYQIKWKKVQKAAKTSESEIANQQPASSNQDQKHERFDAFPAYPHVTLSTEVKLHSVLDKAVDLWDALLDVSEECIWSPIADDVCIMKVAAEIYQGAQRVLQMVRLQQMIIRIGHIQRNAELLLYGGSGMALFLTRNGHALQAKLLLDSIERDTSNCSNCSSTDRDYHYASLRFQLARAENCLFAAEITEGVKHLLSVFHELQRDRNFKHLLLLEAEARILKAKFGKVSLKLLQSLPSEDLISLMNEYPLLEALDSIKLCFFLTKCLKDGSISKKSIADWYLFRQLLINCEMESASVIGQLVLDIGCVRESRCYLKESLTLAQEMLCVTGGVESLLQLAHMDFLCGNINDCLVKLHSTSYTMDAIVAEDVRSFKTSVEENKHNAIESSWLHCKMDLLHNDDDDDDEVFEDNTVSTPSKLYLPRSSPIEQHEIDCSCNRCQYLGLELLRLKALWLQEVCLIKKEGTTGIFIEGVLLQLKDFEQKYFFHIRKSYAYVEKILQLLNTTSFLGTMSKSLLSNEILKLKCLILSSLAGENARGGNLQKASYYLSAAIGDIQKKGVCQHMLVAIHSQLLLEKREVQLQYMSFVQGTTWVELLMNNISLRKEVVSSDLSDLLSNMKLEKSHQPLREANTPKDDEVKKKRTTCRKTLHFAPQKKVSSIHCIGNFNEPSPRNHLSDLEPSETSILIRSDARSAYNLRKRDSQRQKPSQRHNVENISPESVIALDRENVHRRREKSERNKLNSTSNNKMRICLDTSALLGIEGVQVKEEANAPEIPRGRVKEGSKTAYRTMQKTQSQKKRNPRRAESENSILHMEAARESISSFRMSYSEVIGELFPESDQQTNSIHELSNSNSESKTEMSGTMVNLKTIEEGLFAARSLICHYPPYKTISKINFLLAMIFAFKKCKGSSSRWLAAHYFSESLGITLRHQGLVCLQRLIRNGIKEGTDVCFGDSVKEKCLRFSHDSIGSAESVTRNLTNAIPEGWTVIQVCGINSSVLLSDTDTFYTPNLVLCRLQKNVPPVFGFVPTCELEVMKEFTKIMEESLKSLKTSKADVWWTTRRDLDCRMKDLCHTMENNWLGMWKALFLGVAVDTDYQIKSANAVQRILKLAAKLGLNSCNEQLLQAVVDAEFILTPQQLSDAVVFLWNVLPSDEIAQQLHNAISNEAQQLIGNKDVIRHPTVLILDKNIQNLPWENMPLLRGCTVTRVPSLQLLQAQLQSYEKIFHNTFKGGINPRNTFYVLNPRNDLPKTQLKFEELFKRLKWTGVVGQKPTREQMVSAVTEHDLFLYCGHGSGNSCLSGESVEKLKSRAAVVLMGCSSGRLRVLGEMEPIGIVHQYWLSGSPMILANLWDVTDKDIDRFTEEVLKGWLGTANTSVCDAVSNSREACVLSYLIGCAPVVYGVPVFSADKISF